MVIEYQIKRIDLVKVFFYNLHHSRRTQIIILGADVIAIAFTLFIRYRYQGRLVLFDLFIAFMIALGFILVIPALSFLTAKTQKRILSINAEGIETRIGAQSGKLAWKAVDTIVATQERIFITGKNANAFTIPARAFTSDKQRNKFIDLATQYHNAAKS